MSARAVSLVAKYQDLIGIPYKVGGRDTSGLDCVGLAKLMYEREGVAVPRGAFPQEYESVESVIQQMAEQVAGTTDICLPWAAFWKQISLDVCRAGDIVLSFAGDQPHVSVVAHHAPPRYVLTTTEDRGVFLMRYSGTLGSRVYRLRTAA